MKKNITASEFSRIRKMASILMPQVKELQKLDQLLQKRQEVCDQISAIEAGFKTLCGGKSILDLIKITKVPSTLKDGSPRLDSKGNQCYDTVYLPNEKYITPTGVNGGYLLNTDGDNEPQAENPADEVPETAQSEPSVLDRMANEGKEPEADMADPFNY